MPDRRYHVVLNARSGAAMQTELDAEGIAELFRAAGLTASVDDRLDVALDLRIREALVTDARTIVAAGGDGTVTALATALVGSDKELAILPLGTANLLARDLGLPLVLDEAIAQLPALRARRIDVGDMNGRIFLHKVVIGFAPSVALRRERMRDVKGISATLDFLRYFFGKIARPRRLALDVTIDGGRPASLRLRSIAVANNTYDEGFGRIFARRRLDRGLLGVYLIRRFRLSDLLRLSVGMLFGRWRKDAALSIETASTVEIASAGRTAQAMIDGEVETVEMPLRFRIRPSALTVLAAPRPEDAAGDLLSEARPAMATA